jgi:death-on-curing protein
MRYLSFLEVLELHEMIISSSGGSYGIRDIKALESAINQPRITFDQTELYPDIISKASALCFSLVMNHPFSDGNKRVGHAAMETFLILNGYVRLRHLWINKYKYSLILLQEASLVKRSQTGLKDM